MKDSCCTPLADLFVLPHKARLCQELQHLHCHLKQLFWQYNSRLRQLQPNTTSEKPLWDEVDLETLSVWRWNCRSSEQQTCHAMQHLLPQGPRFTGLTLHVGKVSDSLSNKQRSFFKSRSVTWPLVRLGP